MYNNYHKHTHYSNIVTLDTHIKPMHYMERMKELNHNVYFTTEHGTCGSIFESVKLCKQYGFKCVYGIEAYIVPSILDEKDKSNYHIIIIAKTDKARKKINLLLSNANINSFYYKPRINIEELLLFDKDEIYITTACVGGILKDDVAFEHIFLRLYDKFRNNLFIEIQAHVDNFQAEHNKECIELAQKHHLKLIHANDSHYIYPEQSKDRISFLNGKGIKYDYEDNFVLDYPDEQTIIKRYQQQGILNDMQILEAINNTNIFSECEEIQINDDVKMPTIYPNLTLDEKHDLLKNIIDQRFEEIVKEENIQDIKKYKKEIDKEFQVIKETGEVKSVDYFLLNEKIIDLAINKYKGVLTKSGRGSNVAFYINKLLGFTKMDRLAYNIPMYPSRFMSKTRLLESKSMPDCDYNTKNPQPFISATKELLGENNCCWLISYGTFQEKEAFKNYCRSLELEYYKYNEVSKKIDEYKEDEYWGEIIQESSKFVGTICSVSISPCANLIMNENILEEIGVVKTKEGLCCLITSMEVDDWKYLKNDYLTVSVWELIDDVYNSIGIKTHSTKELLELLDDEVWSIYEKGLTCTINQVDGDWASDLVKKYKPKTMEELAMFISSIRPFFASYRDKFLSRQENKTGIQALDDLFKSTSGFLLFQENLMAYLVWLGIPEDQTVTIIKKISKKVYSSKEFVKLESKLQKGWNKQTKLPEKFKESWELIQSHLNYGFNTPHGMAMACDSLYCAYLKTKYPYEYYTVAFNKYKDNLETTAKLKEELKSFNIELRLPKFKKSKSEYHFNKKEKCIYKGISSILSIGEEIGDKLHSIKKTDCFYDLINSIKQQKILNKKQLEILTKLDFFDIYGNSKALLKIIELNYYGKKDSKVIDDQISIFNILNINPIIDIEKDILNKNKDEFTYIEKISFELEYYGYIESILPTKKNLIYITEIVPLYSKKKNKLWSYLVNYESLKGNKKLKIIIEEQKYKMNPVYKGQIINIYGAVENKEFNNWKLTSWKIEGCA